MAGAVGQLKRSRFTGDLGTSFAPRFRTISRTIAALKFSSIAPTPPFKLVGDNFHRDLNSAGTPGRRSRITVARLPTTARRFASIQGTHRRFSTALTRGRSRRSTTRRSPTITRPFASTAKTRSRTKTAPAPGARSASIDRGLADYNKAIRLNPKDAIAFLGRGNAWWAKKDYRKAIADYDAALQLGVRTLASEGGVATSLRKRVN